jgi:hypothetical protein
VFSENLNSQGEDTHYAPLAVAKAAAVRTAKITKHVEQRLSPKRRQENGSARHTALLAIPGGWTPARMIVVSDEVIRTSFKAKSLLVPNFESAIRALVEISEGRRDSRQGEAPSELAPVGRMLPVIGEYVPSRRAVEEWSQNLKILESSNYSKHKFVETNTSLPSLQLEFKVILQKCLGTFAQGLRKNTTLLLPLIRQGTIDPAIEVLLADRLYIVPSRASKIFAELSSEIYVHLRTGGHYFGRWGKLVLKGRDVYFELNELTPQRSIGKKAIVLE